MLTGYEPSARRPKALPSVYDAATSIQRAAIAVREIPMRGVRALDGIAAEDVIDAVSSKLLTPPDIDGLAAPSVLLDPVRSTYLVHVGRRVYRDAMTRVQAKRPDPPSDYANAVGVRALVATLGEAALAATVRRDPGLRYACLTYGAAARCRIAVSVAVDAGAGGPMHDVRALAREAVAQLANEPNAPLEAGAVTVTGMREREAVTAIVQEVAAARRAPVDRDLPPVLEGVLLGALRHGSVWKPIGGTGRDAAEAQAAYDAVKYDALCATSELRVFERAVRCDVAPLLAEHHTPAIEAALRIHASLTAAGRVSGDALVQGAALFDVAREVLESPTAPQTPEYRGAVERLAGAALGTAALYRHARGGETMTAAAAALGAAVAARFPDLDATVRARWEALQRDVSAARALSADRVGDTGVADGDAPARAEAARVAMVRGYAVQDAGDETAARITLTA